MQPQHGNFLLSEHDKNLLENVRQAATRIILPDMDYNSRLKPLDISFLSVFIFNISQNHFTKIMHDPDHPLHNRITFNKNRSSSRLYTIYRPETSKTTKGAKYFFQFFMSHFNK